MRRSAPLFVMLEPLREEARAEADARPRSEAALSEGEHPASRRANEVEASARTFPRRARFGVEAHVQARRGCATISAPFDAAVALAETVDTTDTFLGGEGR